jgi:hypothetical protein
MQGDVYLLTILLYPGFLRVLDGLLCLNLQRRNPYRLARREAGTPVQGMGATPRWGDVPANVLDG